ncbi:hypothetical protein PENSPDRAFT_656685 [Peniophora sp. CONT]|nr:hypothetical protein PENSPDRAFT_656685 [Peniophora sp. CONT]
MHRRPYSASLRACASSAGRSNSWQGVCRVRQNIFILPTILDYGSHIVRAVSANLIGCVQSGNAQRCSEYKPCAARTRAAGSPIALNPCISHSSVACFDTLLAPNARCSTSGGTEAPLCGTKAVCEHDSGMTREKSMAAVLHTDRLQYGSLIPFCSRFEGSSTWSGIPI